MAADAVNTAQVMNDQTGLNIKVETDGPIRSANTAIANQVTNQQAVDAIMREALQSGISFGREIMAGSIDIGRAVRARTIRMIQDTSGEQAAAFDRQMAAGLETKLASIESLLAAGQQQAKTANTTPPQTGTGGAFASGTGSSLYQSLAEVGALLGTLKDLQKAA
jgi:hypothetical protein